MLFLILLILVKEINWHSLEKRYKEMINLTFLLGGGGAAGMKEEPLKAVVVNRKKITLFLCPFVLSDLHSS